MVSQVTQTQCFVVATKTQCFQAVIRYYQNFFISMLNQLSSQIMVFFLFYRLINSHPKTLGEHFWRNIIFFVSSGLRLESSIPQNINISFFFWKIYRSFLNLELEMFFLRYKKCRAKKFHFLKYKNFFGINFFYFFKLGFKSCPVSP